MASGTINGTTSNPNIVCKIEWSSSANINENYSAVTASLYYRRTNTGYTTAGTGTFSINIGGYTGSVNGKQLSIGSDWVLAMSHSANIPHNNDGSRTVVINASGSLPPTSLTSTSCSGSAVLDNIPRATTPQLPSEAQFGASITITLPRASTAFTHRLTYTFGEQSGTIATNAGSSQNWTIPVSLANESIGPYGGYCQITCVTYNGTVSIGTKTVAILLTAPDSMAPIINSVTIAPTDDGQSAYEFFGNKYIQGKSALHITVNATMQYSALLSQCNITVDGKSYSGTDITTDVISTANSVQINVTVMDTRKKTSTSVSTVTVLPYTSPVLSTFSVERCLSDGTADDEGTYLRAKIKYDIDSVNGLNTKSFLLFYRKDGDQQQTSLQFSGGYTYDDVYISTDAILDADYAYNIRFGILDYFTYIQADAQIPTAFTLMDYDSGGKGIAFGEVAQGDGMSVALDTTFKKPVNFLRGIKIDGVQIADYIIENGTSGNWTYRKWASGIAECWGTMEFSCNLEPVETPIYYASGSASLPFAYTTDPLPIVTGSCPWQYANWVNAFVSLSDPSKCEWLYYQTNNNESGNARKVYIHVIGKIAEESQ